MEFSGVQSFAASQNDVWVYLSDINNVAACVPGFQRLETVGADHWKTLISLKIGLMRVKFQCDVTCPEMHPPSWMVMKVTGKAPGNGVAVEGRMQLRSVSEHETEMDWHALVTLQGMLASVGSGMINNLAGQLTQDFFSCLQSKL